MATNLDKIKIDTINDFKTLNLTNNTQTKQILEKIKNATNEQQLINLMDKAQRLKNKQDDSEVNYDLSEMFDNNVKKTNSFDWKKLIPFKNKRKKITDDHEIYEIDEETKNKIINLVDTFPSYFTNLVTERYKFVIIDKEKVVEEICKCLVKDPQTILKPFANDMKRYIVNVFCEPRITTVGNITPSTDNLSFIGDGRWYSMTSMEMNQKLDGIDSALVYLMEHEGILPTKDGFVIENNHSFMIDSKQGNFKYKKLYQVANEIINSFHNHNDIDVELEDQTVQNLQKAKQTARVWGKFILPILFIIIYLFKPFPINYESLTMWIWILVFLVLTLVIYKDENNSKITKMLLTIPFTLFLSFTLGFFIYGQPIIDNGNAAKNQIGNVKELTNQEFSKFTFSKEKSYVVNASMARQLADKIVGEDGVSSKYQIGTESLQNIKIAGENKLYWVFNLVYGNMFSQFSNSNVNKVIIVDANDPSKSAKMLSQNTKNEKYKIDLLVGGFFQQDVSRMVQITNPFKMLTDYSFELDDNLSPHYIVTEYKYQRGFALRQVSGIIDVDLQHQNKQTYYDINHIPAWVDRTMPLDIAQEQISNKGEFVHGVFNFSNLDKFSMSFNASTTSANGSTTTTNDAASSATQASNSSASSAVPVAQANVNYIFLNNHPYFITGLTSKGGDAALQGFILKSLHNNETYHIKITGAIESAAKQSAAGITQNFKYIPANPILVFANSKLQYLIPLVDEGGLIKKFALVEIEHYQNVVLYDSLDAFINNEKSDASFKVIDNNSSNSKNNSSTNSKSLNREQILEKIRELEEAVKNFKE